MRMFAQDSAFYRKVRVDETDDPEALRRLKELEAIDAIRQRFTLAEALSALGVGAEHVLRAQAAAARGEREWPGSAQQPSEEPPRAAVDDGGREAGAGGSVGDAVGGEGAHRAERGDGGVPRRTPPGRSWARPRSGSTSAPCKWTGGSEFMRHSWRSGFDDECRKRGLPLLVLPPRSPQLNGIVERANRTVRVECWSQYRDALACAAVNKALDRYLDYYKQPAPAPLLRHEDPGRICYGGGDGCLTPNVQKVGDPRQAEWLDAVRPCGRRRCRCPAECRGSWRRVWRWRRGLQTAEEGVRAVVLSGADDGRVGGLRRTATTAGHVPSNVAHPGQPASTVACNFE